MPNSAKIFISYNHHDKDIANRLKNELEKKISVL